MSRYKEKSHPVEVLFIFRNQAEREHFIGGLTDGWGENYTDLSWKSGNGCAAPVIAVDLSDEERAELEAEGLRTKRRLGKLTLEEYNRLEELERGDD